MEQHVMEGVTYEIVDVVDGNYSRLTNSEEDQVEYLELNMEVVDNVSTTAEYFSNCEDSQEDLQIRAKSTRPRLPQKLTQANGVSVQKGRLHENHTIRQSENSIEPSQLRENDIDQCRATPRTQLDSLDLFFQSMAQTVLHLPPQVQAKIKMDICKVISRAEIKYCSNGTE